MTTAMRGLIAGLCVAASVAAQEPVFKAGTALGVTSATGAYTAITSNVKVYGAVVSAESCSYDPTRQLIVAVNRGGDPRPATNDAFVSLINHDGSVHTPLWIGATRAGLTLNQTGGSDIQLGKLYVADRDAGAATGTTSGAPDIAVIRLFDLSSGAPAGQLPVPDSTGFNDIAVAKDGTIYATQTGNANGTTPMRIYKISAAGAAVVLVDGAPLALPNGIALDNDGNIVVVNIDSDAVQTFSPDGKLLKTEHAVQPGNDGLVILADGTKYVSSVRQGGISRIRPGRAAELIASGIPSPASMCYDPKGKQLVIPMNNNNALAFVKLK